MTAVRHARAVDVSHTAEFGAGSPSTGGYRRIGDLAAGGMGIVSLCVKHAGRFERLYAVKRMHPHLRADDSMRRMFLDEARLAGLIRHANVVSILDVGEDDDGPYLVMDYIEGTALSRFVRHHIKTERQVPVAVCAQIVAQAARGLHAAHELVDPQGNVLDLVHRDVSPANILLGRDGAVRVTDFGVAKAVGSLTRTTTGLLKGKVGYMSPEHLRFEPLDRRTDLFALGVVMVEALAGRRLYSAEDAAATARRILHEPPPDIGDERTDVPPALVELSYELLAKNPDDRPASAAEVADRIDEIVAECGHVDIAGYLEATMGDVLAQEREALHAQPTPPNLPAPQTRVELDGPAASEASGGPRRLRWGLAAALVVGALLTAVMWTRAQPAAPSVAAVDDTPTPTTPSTATLQIDSRPSGADVRVGDRSAGTTPVTVELPTSEGEVTLTLSLAGYEAASQTLVPSHNERLLVTLAPSPEETTQPETKSDPEPPAPARRPARPRSGRPRAKSAIRSEATDPGTSKESKSPKFRRFD